MDDHIVNSRPLHIHCLQHTHQSLFTCWDNKLSPRIWQVWHRIASCQVHRVQLEQMACMWTINWLHTLVHCFSPKMVQDGKNEVKEALSVLMLCVPVFIFTSDGSALLGPMLWFIDLTVANSHNLFNTLFRVYAIFFMRKQTKPENHMKMAANINTDVQSINTEKASSNYIDCKISN